MEENSHDSKKIYKERIDQEKKKFWGEFNPEGAVLTEQKGERMSTKGKTHKASNLRLFFITFAVTVVICAVILFVFLEK